MTWSIAGDPGILRPGHGGEGADERPVSVCRVCRVEGEARRVLGPSCR